MKNLKFIIKRLSILSFFDFLFEFYKFSIILLVSIYIILFLIFGGEFHVKVNL